MKIDYYSAAEEQLFLRYGPWKSTGRRFFSSRVTTATELQKASPGPAKRTGDEDICDFCYFNT